MKKSKIIVPALGLLLLSTAASVSGTVAWFSANNAVTVTGMVVRTKVSDNILISADNVLENFTTSLTQSRTGAVLEPASTIDGEHFYYTTNATASGDAKQDVYVAYSEATPGTYAAAGKTAYDAAFNTAYGQTEVTVTTGAITSADTRYAYIDYSFYLQATNTAAAAKNLNMTKCNLLYDSNGSGSWAVVTEKAWRVSMFAAASSYTEGTTITEVTDAACAVAANEKTKLALTGAAYFTSGKAVSSTSALDSVAHLNANSTVAEIASGATGYYKVVVRLWLEGEDNTCNNATFASLVNTYKLDLAFKFDADPANHLNALQSSTAI